MKEELKIEKLLKKTHDYTAKQVTEDAIKSAKLAHNILDKIIIYIKPGIKESEVKEYAHSLFSEYEIERLWHPPYVRFGEHTLLTFYNRATEDFVLQEEDIAFVDIGIVRNEIEGDAARTVAFGSNIELHNLAKSSELIFINASQFWKENNPSGIELYDYIFDLAKMEGVKFNLNPAGHLIGAFPHTG